MIKDLNAPSRWNMRIWDVDKKEWLGSSNENILPYYGFDIRGGEVATIQGMEYAYDAGAHHDLIWEQSTGLADKNGKEIYEGDVVRVYKNNPGAKEASVETEVVEWSKSFCCWGTTPWDEMEVVGNIHENEKLAKEMK